MEFLNLIQNNKLTSLILKHCNVSICTSNFCYSFIEQKHDQKNLKKNLICIKECYVNVDMIPNLINSDNNPINILNNHLSVNSTKAYLTGSFSRVQ